MNRRFQVRYGIWDTKLEQWVDIDSLSFETAAGDDDPRQEAGLLNLLDEVVNG